jgi:hypothetical protein
VNPLVPAGKSRGFRLVVEPAGAEAYGLRLEETNGSSARPPVNVARADARGTRRVVESVLAALRDSRLPRSSLAVKRRKPLVLAESAGVRLALVLIATAPLVKPERIEAVAGGVASMSTEEAYYWYAKCTGREYARARRALRMFLAEE